MMNLANETQTHGCTVRDCSADDCNSQNCPGGDCPYLQFDKERKKPFRVALDILLVTGLIGLVAFNVLMIYQLFQA